MFSDELKNRLKSVHAYAVTPFNPHNILELDLDGFARNIEFMVERGVEVINVGGGTGEFNALSVNELESITRHAVEIAADKSLIVPTLPGNLADAVILARKYESLGVPVALAMAPYLRNNIPDDFSGVVQYYQTLGQISGLALLPYNTQGWSADMFARLADVKQIIGVKDPCFDDHPLFRAIKTLGDRFVWIGNKRHDPGVLHFRFQAGIDGFTAGFINFAPSYELELFGAATERKWDRMIEIQAQLAPLERLRSAYGEGLIKCALDLVGLTGGPVRPPRVDLSGDGKARLVVALDTLGVEVK